MSQGGSLLLSALAENHEIYRDTVSSFLLLGPASRLDRCLHFNLSFYCWLNEINPKIVQSPRIFSETMSKLTAPINIEYPAVMWVADQDPSLCSDLGLHNAGGHY